MEPEQIGTLPASSRPPLHQDENTLDVFDGAERPISPRNAPTRHSIPATLSSWCSKTPQTPASAPSGEADLTSTKSQVQSHTDNALEQRRGKNWKQSAPTQLTLSPQVDRAIFDSVGKFPAETGGLLGGDRQNYAVEHFHFDTKAQRSTVTYSPNTETLNKLLSSDWDLRGIEVLGFIHSHPSSVIRPSTGDLIYARRILSALPNMPYMLMPIVQPGIGNQNYRVHAYAVSRAEDSFEGHDAGILIPEYGVRLHTLQVRVVPGDPPDEPPHGKPDALPSQELSPLSILLWLIFAALLLIEFRRSSHANRGLPFGRFEHHPSPDISGDGVGDSTFERVVNAYDLDLLNRSRIVSVGMGGAAAFAEDLARAGIGEQVIIDADTVSVTNIATQQVYRRDQGRPKVEVVAQRLRDINPDALAAPRQQWLDDIGDAQMERLLFAPGCELDPASNRTQSPQQVLLCGLTDNFKAQARINRIALQFGVPSLCAQVYHEGRGAEISFTVPGITPACHRCALASRYAAYLKNGFQNDVTSHGTPIFATTRLNALKGFIALAILHRGTDHPRWGGLIERIGDRNLVILRLDPDIGQTLGLSVFDRVFGSATENSVLFDEAIWRPQKPDNPSNGHLQCPDCGGTGDLRNAIGNFGNTLVMPFCFGGIVWM